jgi:hypothetical protein
MIRKRRGAVNTEAACCAFTRNDDEANNVSVDSEFSILE